MPDGYSRSDDKVNQNCSTTGAGTYCAAKIVRDGWKINDDYPFK